MSKLSLEIDHFLRTSEGDFDALALELFAYQYERNIPYRLFCDAQAASPASITHWKEIPAVPIGAFKSAELCTFPSSRSAAIFHSSTTSTGTPSRHFVKDLRYYEASLKAQFARWIPSDNKKYPFLILAPSPADAPHSSLSWMLDVVQRAWGGAGGDYFVRRDRLNEPRLFQILKQAVLVDQPVVLLGTTIAFLSLFDFLSGRSERIGLPRGSRLMDTGGMKTSNRSVTRPEFVAQAADRLGLPAEACINEYGMCELSSQFYGRGVTTDLAGPPWMRTRAISSLTGLDAAPGEPGLLWHYDLANVDSVLAIQTEDIGVLNPTGFRLQGRAAAAELRGCSLLTEKSVS